MKIRCPLHSVQSIHYKKKHRDFICNVFHKNVICNDTVSFNFPKLWLELLHGYENRNKYPGKI